MSEERIKRLEEAVLQLQRAVIELQQREIMRGPYQPPSLPGTPPYNPMDTGRPWWLDSPIVMCGAENKQSAG